MIESKPGSSGHSADQPITTYAQALSFLNQRQNLERVRVSTAMRTEFKLDRMRELMSAMGEPHKAFKSVHVTGSKGKGSICEMTAACLRGCGYTVGLYMSPHLVDIRERIRLGGDMISEADFTRQMEKVRAGSLKLDKALGELSFFEVMTAACFAYFAEQAIDVAVIEVGIGGRLDATNVITPEVSAIGAIQLEHADILGDTVEKIAAEKAGIFKPGVPALSIPQSKDSIVQVFREQADRVGAPLAVVGKDIEFTWRFEASPDLGPHVRVCVSTARSNFEHLPVPLKGEHQAYNCGLALAIVDQLRARGFDAPEGKVALGLAMTPNLGRMELVNERPRIIVDGAHNPESIGALVKSIGAYIRYDSMVMIFGCAADKDVPGMLAKIATGADKVIFTRSESQRAAEPRELQRRFADVSPKMTQLARNLPEAMDIALRAVARDDLIVIAGSFYLAGEAKRHIAAMRSRK